MSYRHHLERMTANRDQILNVILGKKDKDGKRQRPFDEGVIDDLVRRGQHEEADAYPKTSGGDGMPRGKAEMTPVEAQANAELFGKPAFDNVAAALRRIDSELDKAARSLVIAHNARLFVELVNAKTLGRVNSVDLCTECSKPILGKTKRLDGQPYHRPQDQRCQQHAVADIECADCQGGSCWWKAYNRTRGRRAS